MINHKKYHFQTTELDKIFSNDLEKNKNLNKFKI